MELMEGHQISSVECYVTRLDAKTRFRMPQEFLASRYELRFNRNVIFFPFASD